MKKILLTAALSALFLSATAQTKWYDPLEGDENHIQGRAWTVENAKNYHRLPHVTLFHRNKGALIILNQELEGVTASA